MYSYIAIEPYGFRQDYLFKVLPADGAVVIDYAMSLIDCIEATHLIPLSDFSYIGGKMIAYTKFLNVLQGISGDTSSNRC